MGNSNAVTSKPKVVRVIPAIASTTKKVQDEYRQKRVVAYCRVSTKEEEQLNSYENQLNYYTDTINKKPDWKFVGIFADKGITGTSVKRRDEFNKMIALCKRGKVDMIITKSISRFARNTVDCLTHTRMLKKIGVDVYFEEEKIHSILPGAEFMITLFGSIAQNESENISANVIWGKAQSAKEGNVAFHYKYFLGYEKGTDGKPQINEEQAQIIRFIYERFLAGDSLLGIAHKLEERKILSPKGNEKWKSETIRSILSNERYKGDAIINKTFIVDCLTKEVRVNNGERVKYYVENNHPAIIDAKTFGLVQEELARRAGKSKVKQRGTKTEQGKYSSKYALTELLVCGECKTPYRRCTWTSHGKKRIMWRCINRLDFGRKYCKNSPSIEEGVLHKAITSAIKKTAIGDSLILQTLKRHISMGIGMSETEDEDLEIQMRIMEIDSEFHRILEMISADTVDDFDMSNAEILLKEKEELEAKLLRQMEIKQKRKNAQSRFDDICTIIDGLKNHPLDYDDELVRKIIECVVVESKEKIKIVFIGGLTIEQNLYE